MRPASLRQLAYGVCLLAAIAACRDSTAATPAPDAELNSYWIGERPWQASLLGALGSRDGGVSLVNCALDASTNGRIVCPDLIREDLTIASSYQLLDANGVPQSQKGPNVFSINARVRVSGSTPAFRTGGTATIDRASELTQVGFGPASTQHTANGTETGTIATTRVDASLGTINTIEVFTHTVRDLVTPNSSGLPWPISGVVTRTVLFERTVASTGEKYTLNYNEVTTFNGVETLQSVVTINGQTFTCIWDELGRLRCN